MAEDGFTVTGETKAESVLISDSIVWREHDLCNWQRAKVTLEKSPINKKFHFQRFALAGMTEADQKGDRTNAPIERAFQK